MMRHMIVERKSATIRHTREYLTNRSSILRLKTIDIVAQKKSANRQAKMAFVLIRALTCSEERF